MSITKSIGRDMCSTITKGWGMRRRVKGKEKDALTVAYSLSKRRAFIVRDANKRWLNRAVQFWSWVECTN